MHMHTDMNNQRITSPSETALDVTQSHALYRMYMHTHMYALTLNEPHLQKQFYTCMNNQWSTSPLKIGLDVMQSHPLHAHCWWVGSSVNPLANYLRIYPTKSLYMHLSTISMCGEIIIQSLVPTLPYHTDRYRWLWQMVMVTSPHRY